MTWTDFEWNEGGDSLQYWFTTDALDVGTWDRNEQSLRTTANVRTFERLSTCDKRKDIYGGLYVKPDTLTQDELEMIAAIETEIVLDERDYSAVEHEWNERAVDDWVWQQTAKALGWDDLEMDYKQIICLEQAILRVMGDYSHWESSGLYVDTDNAEYLQRVKDKTHEYWVKCNSDAAFAAKIMDGYVFL